MNLLLTNDDGMDAPGLAALANALDDLGVIRVSAPATNCSAIGHAITIDRDIMVGECPAPPAAAERIRVQGTPADAVKFALTYQWPDEPPELVVSGINAGPNIGYNVYYSGTLAAAREAMFHGVSSVAVSASDFRRPFFQTAAHFARRVVRLALDLERRRRENRERPPFCLNLNVPSLPLAQVKGVRCTRHGTSGFQEFFVPRPGDGDKAFRIDGRMQVRDRDLGFGGSALFAGYATLTPLKLELTDHELLEAARAGEWEQRLNAARG